MKVFYFLLFLFPGAAEAEYGAHLGSHFGFGRMGDDSESATQSRSIGSFDIQAMPGWRLSGRSILIGLHFDLRFMSQLSNYPTLTPLGGNGLLIGPGFALDLPAFKFLFSWDWRDRHNASGAGTSYKGSGFHLLFGYRISGNLSVDLEYVRARYNSVVVNGAESSLADTAYVVHKNLGFGLSWSY